MIIQNKKLHLIINKKEKYKKEMNEYDDTKIYSPDI